MDTADGSKDNADQYAAAFSLMHLAGITVGELWVYYFSIGGSVGEFEVNAYLHGLIRLPALDRDLLSQSLNEMYDDLCRSPRAPFSANIHERKHDS
ncbi:hypothetical protein ACX80U_17475 [Arthrobacter sp. TmT3-37]